MKKQYRNVIAEDHTILRERFGALLCADPDFSVVGVAKDGRDALQCIETLSPDLVLMDLSMSRTNGLEAIKEIQKRNPETKVLALRIYRGQEYILATLRAGADGYVLKDATPWDTLTQRKREILKLIAEGYKNREIAD